MYKQMILLITLATSVSMYGTHGTLDEQKKLLGFKLIKNQRKIIELLSTESTTQQAARLKSLFDHNKTLSKAYATRAVGITLTKLDIQKNNK